MLDEEITLLYYENTNGSIQEITIDILADKKSVSRQEFYASYQKGLNVALVFEIWECDYELTKRTDKETNRPLFASKIIYDGAEYDIIRTYPMPNGMVELICS